MKRTLIALALAALLPISAQAADGLSYSYIEGGYTRASIAGDSADGYFGKGSFKFNDSFYGNIGYRRVTESGSSLDETVIGAGFRHAISEKADFNVELAYVNLGVDVTGFGSGDSDGYRAAFGVRGMMSDSFEGNIKAYYTDISDLGGEFGVQVGGVVKINDTWGVVGSYDHTELLDEGLGTWNLGLRASF